MIKSFFQGPWTGKHIWTLILAFFGAVIVANMVMIYFAVNTFHGVEDRDAYAKGRDYNQVIAAGAAQRRLGLDAVLAHRLVEQGGGDAVAVSLTLADAKGAAVPSLKPVLTLRRPSEATLDRTAAMVEPMPGRYTATLDLPKPGKWEIRITAKHPDGTALRWDKPVVLAP
ncbi:nitrogen fixation protein FixH [Rhodothalassium salexigens DSM 2132]|uniref:Nitrogen fixation protein FixH n=1 Tax=Rhodothalassium salexigens DSM 2132 TaxID=1188247 RepID=A0A4R2PSX0_RHOSA|nr:FixH family protein [Rhodothalassium salexigens]MBB4210039.1 nitrogen fixation protein FixH [Rhodothalassium salexigens DSM 2132]MBK1637590.1 hypothetical protein [Rhodothalassium salexigens DSM 2132]TCP38204.1 nitrogen fixation protein FixH [Rhodothalassium salexigens DSM 2132]